MIAPTSVDTNLSQLLEEVSSGKIQLPEFQIFIRRFFLINV